MSEWQLYTIPIKIEARKLRKPFVCYARSPGEAHARARKCVPHWMDKRFNWEPGMLTRDLLQ